MTPGSNRNASFKCQWIIYYGKLISCIKASLFRVGEEETVNASWISIVLLSFEVLLHLRVITGLLNFAMHSTSVAEVTGSFFILTRMGEI